MCYKQRYGQLSMSNEFICNAEDRDPARSHAPSASGRHLFKVAVPPHVARPSLWPYPLHALPGATITV